MITNDTPLETSEDEARPYKRDPDMDSMATPRAQTWQAAAKTVHARIDALCVAANTAGADYFDSSTNMMLATRDLLVALGMPHETDAYRAAASVTPVTAEQWAIAKQVAVIEGDDKNLGYTIIEPSELYDSFEQAAAIITQCQLPLGWVAIRISQLFPDAAAPQEQAPAADLNSWKARALEAENTVLKWEARATALDHASLDAILSALEDPQHQAEQEAEKAFYRNEGLEQAARWIDSRRAAFDDEHGATDPATGTFEFKRYEQLEYSSELHEIAEGIRGLQTTFPKSEANA